MNIYKLYKSELEHSYTLVSVEDESATGTLPSDAEVVWETGAKSFDIACLKRNEYLGWEPYRPMIACDHDLRKYIPVDKHDVENIRLLINLGYPTIVPVLRDMFECLQDFNWPIAKEAAPFLSSLGASCKKTIEEIFNSDDSVWKYWIIQEVIEKMTKPHAAEYIPLLNKLKDNLSSEDIKEEVDIAISEALAIIST